MKKKLVLVSVVIALVAILITGATLAYFTAEDSAKNEFTNSKGVDIEVSESDWDPEEEHPLIPGATIKKNPTISLVSDGDLASEDAFIRVKAVINNKAALDAIFAAHAGEEDFDITKIVALNPGWECLATDCEADADADTRTYYIYYTDALTQSNPSATAFNEIVVPEGLTSEEVATIKDFYIDIIGQAIQAEGFADVRTAFDAWED